MSYLRWSGYWSIVNNPYWNPNDRILPKTPILRVLFVLCCASPSASAVMMDFQSAASLICLALSLGISSFFFRRCTLWIDNPKFLNLKAAFKGSPSSCFKTLTRSCAHVSPIPNGKGTIPLTRLSVAVKLPNKVNAFEPSQAIFIVVEYCT